VALHEIDSRTPRLTGTASDGSPIEITCDFIAGCDGSHGVARKSVADATPYLRVYPFGWFGILAEAPPSIHELIYARSRHGFALISTRSETVQRMYFQCDPETDPATWSEAQIWDTLQNRVACPGFSLKEGPIFQKNVIPLRSFVCEPMRHGRLFLAGDAAHAVPPTGAKGLNLAANDVMILSRALERYYADGTEEGLTQYSPNALRRVWRAQHFSWWMTSMLHNFADANAFDERRQRAELELVTGEERSAAALAALYAGAPLGT
jgi:p-hydroxybenzoate 3-monooxygenase